MLSIDRNPPRRQLRQFAVLQVVFFAIVAAWLHHRFGLVVAPLVVLAASAVAGIVGYFRPAFMRYVWIGWMTAVWPIGWAVAHLVLACIFYLILTPIGLTMKLLGHDPLRRTFDRDASSHWIRCDRSADPDRYFRQF
ncbi:MAG: SxtJ family membrane protein [Planctomycetaceae bacterium]